MLNERLNKISEKLKDYFYKFKPLDDSKDYVNYVLDIEACAIKNHSEMLTYSIACMSCNDDSDMCYWYNDVESFLLMLMRMKSKEVNIYIHNLLYDIKPFILRFVEMYGNNTPKLTFKERTHYNKFTKERVTLKTMNMKELQKVKPFEYNMVMKEGVLYKVTLQSETTTINFYDTFKIVPFSLQKCCEDFLGLKLPKDGLDYNKERTLDEELTNEELQYIYNDVYGLSYLVKMLVINGFDINGKHIQFTKLTNSGQSMYDYKETIMEDYENKQNMFANEEVYMYVDNNLMKSKYFSLDKTKNYDLMLNLVFQALYPTQSYFTDTWQRHSYYGGLSTVCFENVEKYKNRKDKHGVVLDVNSLYPFVMDGNEHQKFLLPYGDAHYNDKPYKFMSESYKNNYPLYIQELIIYEFDVKHNKMPFVQVKNNPKFNGREVIKNNIKDGVREPIKLRLCNPLLELLFECYDVKSYVLKGHMAFCGAYDLFHNYIEYWGSVKQNETGAKRATAKLRQNGLYGKFGMCGDNEVTNFVNKEGKFTIEHTHEEYISDTVYLPMATFITSYAKQYLVMAINNNYDRFMYCDTDSLHLFGTLEEVKGLRIGGKKYGYWDNEMVFDDFVYIGSKRYAEKNIKTGEWEIKCCGLTDKIMKNLKDIKVFNNCKHSKKELDKMKFYKKNSEEDVYYYYDKECTQKIVGLIKSKKSKIVKYGTDIIEQPYKISNNYFM